MDTTQSASLPLPEESSGGGAGALQGPACVLLIVWLGDFLFWKHWPGISIALFVCAIAAIVVSRSRDQWKNPVVRIAFALLAAASCATALEISFTNICVLMALLAVICGECWYGGLAGHWARWSESLVAWIAAAGRWVWVTRRLNNTQLAAVALSPGTVATTGRLLRIVAPVAVLAAVFGFIFGSGNAIFAEMCQHIADEFWKQISRFDLSGGRPAFWLVLATLALAWVFPRPGPLHTRLWARTIPRITRGDKIVALWQGRLALLTLNALFFIVNTIDVFYLWNHAQLPRGVTFSQFVHGGVGSLITAVLLSALVIAVIFQQEDAVKHGTFLKACALFWIAQNFLLIAGVFLRLKLYVQAYQLSEERVYVGCFLLLVAAGFALLAWHVAREGRLNTLIFRNMLAAFALFFLLQFANVSAVVARYNVKQWQRDPKRTLDLGYIASLGPGAWPALADVASMDTARGDTVGQARLVLWRFANAEKERRENFDWRSWQARRDLSARWLIEQSKMYPPL